MGVHNGRVVLVAERRPFGIDGDDGVRFFDGDEVLVKHDENYDAENKDRVATAEGEAAACSQKD